jgi:hypothetical protein
MSNANTRNTAPSRRARGGPSFDESMLPTEKAGTTVHVASAVRAGPAVDHRLVFVGFDLPNADDGKGEPVHAPDYLLTVAQARDLVEQLRDALSVLRKPSAP